jgi:DNA-binding protein HU-beta
MNKKELVTHLAEHAEVSKNQAESVLNALATTILDTVRAGGELAIPDIGKFGVKDVAARTGHNPKTGEAIQIAAKRAPKFTIAKALKDAAAKS